jgi:hypothetical protein
MDVLNGLAGARSGLGVEAGLARIQGVGAWLNGVRDSIVDILGIRTWVEVPPALEIYCPCSSSVISRNLGRTLRLRDAAGVPVGALIIA